MSLTVDALCKRKEEKKKGMSSDTDDASKLCVTETLPTLFLLCCLFFA